MAAIALVGLALLSQGGGLERGDADATVVLHLRDDAPVNLARQQIAAAAPAWGARRVGEVSTDDASSTLRFALPGANLDAAIAWLRNPANTDAERESVDYAVDPDQLDLTPLSSGEAGSAPDPVTLEVQVLAAPNRAGGLAGFGMLLLAGAALVALVFAWRWYRDERDLV